MSDKSVSGPTPQAVASGHQAAQDRAPRAASGLDTVRTIAWSFFGVRRRNDHERESRRINPIHVVVAGFFGVLVLVAGLILLVNVVVAK